MSLRFSSVGGLWTAKVAAIGLVGALMSGCSSDVGRFTTDFDHAMRNPFEGEKVASTTPTTVRPSHDVAYARPAPVASAPLPPPQPVAAAPARVRPVETATHSGSAAGWTAAGGSPVVVAEGDTLEVISRRYGVPTTALLNVNGLTGSGQVHAGLRIVVPVYNAGDGGNTRIATIDDKPHHVRRTDEDIAAADQEKPQRAHHRSDEKDLSDPEDKGHRAHRRDKDLETADSEDKPKHGRKHGIDLAKADDEGKSARKHVTDKAEDRLAKADEKAAKAKDKDKVKGRDTEIARADDKSVAKSTKTAKAGKDAVVADASPTTKTLKAAPAAKAEEARVASSAKRLSVDESDKTATGSVRGGAAAGTQVADAAPSAPEFRWPARGRVIQGYKTAGNNGIDISVPEGTPVHAAENGTILYSGAELKGGYGKIVLIKHDSGYITAYAYNGELNVKVGERVKRGQVIAKSGQSGNATSPQLHFEVRRNNSPVDPSGYLTGG